MKISWKRLGQVLLISLVIAVSLAFIYLVYHAVRIDGHPAETNSCALQESKPVLIIMLNGPSAIDICTKINEKSNGRYFTYYGEPSTSFQVMCAVMIRHVQYTVYDIVPGDVTPTTRYSMLKVCPLLQQHHRLIGEGF